MCAAASSCSARMMTPRRSVTDRLEVYHRETEPLKGFYEARGILKTVENQPSVEETSRAILHALGR